MSELRGSQRKYLRGLAHSYKPVVQVGKEGLSENVFDAIDTALEARELIKVKIAAERENRERFARAIESQLDCECVGAVGRMAIFYREQPDPEKRKVQVPGTDDHGPAADEE